MAVEEGFAYIVELSPDVIDEASIREEVIAAAAFNRAMSDLGPDTIELAWKQSSENDLPQRGLVLSVLDGLNNQLHADVALQQELFALPGNEQSQRGAQTMLTALASLALYQVEYGENVVIELAHRHEHDLVGTPVTEMREDVWGRGRADDITHQQDHLDVLAAQVAAGFAEYIGRYPSAKIASLAAAYIARLDREFAIIFAENLSIATERDAPWIDQAMARWSDYEITDHEPLAAYRQGLQRGAAFVLAAVDINLQRFSAS